MNGKRRLFLAALLAAPLIAASASPGSAGAHAGGVEPGMRPHATEAGGTLNIATASLGNESLDPITSITDNNRYLTLMFDSLVGVDYLAEEISKDTGVAEDWAVSDDGLVYTFTLREGITFHNGDPLTAEDVKFSLDRYQSDEAATPNTARLRGLIESVTVLSPTQVEVRLTAPSVMFLTLISAMSDPGGLIIPKNHFEEVGAEAFAQNPIGSGPYRFVERQTGSQIRLEKATETHFSAGDPLFDEVIFHLVSDENTRVAQLQAGDMDFADIGIDKVAVTEDAGLRIFEHNGPSVVYVYFQLQRPDEATQDMNLRQALSHAINREELAEALLYGLATPTGNVWPGVGTPIPPDEYDPELAQQELADSAYGPDGEPLELIIQSSPTDGWPQMLSMTEAIQAYWAEIGIQSTIEYRDFAAFRAEWLEGQLPPPTIMHQVYGAQVDWQSIVNTVWTCEGLLSSVCDPELDELNAQWGASTTMEEYLEMADVVEQTIVGNYYVIPILYAPQFYAGNDRLPEGYQPGNSVRSFNTRAMVTQQ
jgi:peptide/nickel transport system substrate-binding protein